MAASSGYASDRFEASVYAALRDAGWFTGRSIDISNWVRQLSSVGYDVSERAKRAWAEFGQLTVRSAPDRVPKSSLCVDPVDAGIDTVDEAQRLGARLDTTFAPLGMWSSQFRAYIGEEGRVVAVGPRSAWFLGSDIESTLKFVVQGEGRGIARPDIEDWI